MMDNYRIAKEFLEKEEIYYIQELDVFPRDRETKEVDLAKLMVKFLESFCQA